jgi:hypothetical protein
MAGTRPPLFLKSGSTMIVIPVSSTVSAREIRQPGKKDFTLSFRKPEARCPVPVYVTGNTKEMTRFYQALFSFRLAWPCIL